jgi:FkbM family methyltransferase
VFLDVGANVGLITFQVAYRRPAARIHAFEANPAAAESWRSNHRLNPSGRTTMEPVAVSSAPGAVTFRAPEADLGGGAVTRDGSGITVPATTLDAYCGVNGIDAIDVMKVDVEGSEPDVLDGARELLSAGAIRAVVMELNDGWLSARGLSRGDLIARLAEHRLLPAGPTTGGDVVFDLAAR